MALGNHLLARELSKINTQAIQRDALTPSYKPSLRLRVLLLFALLAFSSSASYAQAPFSFALLGDVPYGLKPGKTDRYFDATVNAINADESIRWTIHVGDIKSGKSRCSDAIMLDRKARFHQFKKPFMLTPGDNEWTDCHRLMAGAYDPLERLAFLRQTFYSPPNQSLGQQPMSLTSQGLVEKKHSEFVENQLWEYNNVTFATIHLTGSRNGQAPFDKLGRVKQKQRHRNEVYRRNKAALNWLNRIFAHAEKYNHAGILIAIHANPGLERGAQPYHKKPFIDFLTNLERKTLEFDRPVVLAHGDSHYFRIDRPAITKGQRLKNFTRIETFGDSNRDWIKVTVAPETPYVFNAVAMSSD